MAFDIDTIRDAADRIERKARRTPLLRSPMLDDLVGARVLVKAESLQLTGSFKIRGALNAVLSSGAGAASPGVAAFSTGNHGQAVAAAARTRSCPAVIVMPHNAPRVKVDGCRWWGAEIVFYDPDREDREDVVQSVIRERGVELIHPFDDERVMSGQGTVGLEIVADLARWGIIPDAVVMPCSGGGLSAGVTEAVTHAHPGVASVVVERAGYDKMARSLAAGQPERIPAVSGAFLDAIGAPNVGRHPLAALSRHDVRPMTVTDEEARVAMREAFRSLKLVVEPGGAAGLAAVLAQPERFVGQTVVVVASGGNVDASVFAQVLAGST